MAKRIWLDCDPGHDDAMAIIMAAYGSENIKLLGMSTVYGNQTVLNTTQNAVKVHYAAGLAKDIKIVKGAAKPLVRSERSCGEIHGSSGLDTKGDSNHSFPKMERLMQNALDAAIIYPDSSKAINVMNEVITKVYEETGEKVTMVCTGAFTNFALLLSVYPEIISKIERLVTMSGAMGLGNTGPSSEWNVELDPEAAKIVFSCGLPIVQIPLEVTHTVLITPEIIEQLKQEHSKFLDWIVDLFHFFTESYSEVFNFKSPPLHDPTTIAYLIDPSMFKTKLMNVEIETSSPLTFGQTVCDYYGLSGRPKNVEMCLSIDVEKFWALQIQSLKVANSRSPLNFE